MFDFKEEIPPGFIKKSWICKECDYRNTVISGVVNGIPLSQADNCSHQFKVSFAEMCKWHIYVVEH